MEKKIRDSINDPNQLEQLYRTDKVGFEKAFLNIYSEFEGAQLADFWKLRLETDNDTKLKIWKADLPVLIITCLIAAILIKIPRIFNIGISDEIFYAKNGVLIAFLGISTFIFLSKASLSSNCLLISATIFIISVVFINLLPYSEESQTVLLSYLHLPFMLWCLFGLIYIDFDWRDKTKRIDYIRYNGDMAILGAIVLIAGGILTVITLGLFQTIEINIQDFYYNYIIIPGLVCSPAIVNYFVKNFPFLTNKIAPVISSLFSPIVLLTLIIFLVSILFSGKDPYNNRDFLVVFNVMLVGVMCLVVFFISEVSGIKKQRFNEIVLFALSIVSIIVDLVALSAILYRLNQYGFTPNRTVVLGSNLLILINLFLILIDLYKVNFKKKDIQLVGKTIAGYLPVYAVWTVFVTFILPFIFGLK